MPLNFPDSPSTNDPYTYGNRSWISNGRAWVASGQIVGYTGSRGTTGYAGSIGNLGYSGSAGALGYTGSSGPSFVNIYTSGALYVFDGSRRWYAPYNLSISSIVANLVTSADSNLIFSIKKNGVTAATITISTGQYTTTYSTPFTMNSGNYLTISILQVGSTNSPGSELYVQLKYNQI